VVVGFGDIEGPPTQRIRVEDCTFRNLSVRAVSIACPSGDYDQGGDPQFIALGNGFFLPAKVPALQVRNSAGVAHRSNVFYHDGAAPRRSELVVLINSPLRTEEDNRFVPVASARGPRFSKAPSRSVTRTSRQRTESSLVTSPAVFCRSFTASYRSAQRPLPHPSTLPRSGHQRGSPDVRGRR
jgi:hypothetical protein